MSKLPLLSPKELVRIVEKLGFSFVRQVGSHMTYQHPDGRKTVIPNHPGEDIDRGLLNKIIKKELMLTREEFQKLLT